MIYVPDVELEFLLPGDGVAAVALGPAGDAGAHFVAAGLLRGVEGKVLHEQGARADQGHVADEDVPDLGQLVDGRGADEAPDARQALLVGQEVALGVALVGHGLELHYAEDFAVFAGALLEEEGAGALVGEVEPQGDEQQEPSYAQEQDEGYAEVNQAFEEVFIHCQSNFAPSPVSERQRVLTACKDSKNLSANQPKNHCRRITFVPPSLYVLHNSAVGVLYEIVGLHVLMPTLSHTGDLPGI